MEVMQKNMTIYLDIVLLENLIMNYIILFATGLISKINIKQFKIIISSLIGACYAIMSFITSLNLYNTIILKVILSIVMIYIAFNPKNVKKLVKELLVFYLISFAFGGCAFFLLYYIKPQDILSKNGVLIGSYPLKIAVLGGILGFFIVNITFKLIKDKFLIFYKIYNLLYVSLLNHDSFDNLILNIHDYLFQQYIKHYHLYFHMV